MRAAAPEERDPLAWVSGNGWAERPYRSGPSEARIRSRARTLPAELVEKELTMPTAPFETATRFSVEWELVHPEPPSLPPPATLRPSVGLRWCPACVVTPLEAADGAAPTWCRTCGSTWQPDALPTERPAATRGLGEPERRRPGATGGQG